MKNKLSYLSGLVLILMVACQPQAPKEVTKYNIEQFLNNVNLFGGSFSQDESKILFGSDETGIYNAYFIDLETGEQSALTESKDRTIRPISFFPSDDRILYISDNNGDEIDHIFVRNEDGSIEDLTPVEGAKAIFFGWSHDRSSFFYGFNDRDPNFFDVYELKIADFGSSRIFENTDGLSFGGISNNKKYLAFTKPINTNDSDLFVYDRDTGEMTKISESLAAYSPADFSVDNSSMYYLTDGGSEFQYLMKYDLDSGTKTKIQEEDWDIWYAYFSETGKYRVVGINNDASTEIKIFDTESGGLVDFPDFGEGDITSVNISRSENLMSFYLGSSNSPSDLYIYDFESGEYNKLSNTLNPEIDPVDLVKAEVIRYTSHGNIEIPAIFYKPHNASTRNKVPAMVWVHGGPGGQSRTGYFSLIQYLVNHGYAILAVNNRGSSGYGKTFFKMDDQNHGEGDLMDCVAGKNYLASLDFIDPDQIGIIGGSYGGYMVMRAMTHTPEEFKVGVNIFGVTNWIRTLRSIPPWWAAFKDALYTEMGDPYSADSVRLHNISPLFHADQIVNPVMVLQGSQDPRVLQVESDEMVEEMKKNNVPVEYVLFEDEGHGFSKKENQLEGWEKILTFLNRHHLEEETMKG